MRITARIGFVTVVLSAEQLAALEAAARTEGVGAPELAKRLLTAGLELTLSKRKPPDA